MPRGPDRAVERAEVLAEMQAGEPETASTLAEQFPVHPDTIYNRLQELQKLGEIKSKKPGARSRVWWKPADITVDPSLIRDDMFRSSKDPDILRALARARNAGEPRTTKEIAEEIGDSQDIVYNRLRVLVDDDWVDSLKSGATSKVWWLNEDRLEDNASEIPA
jgi:DNA-binding IclR family transcriptional regulator